MIGKRIILLSLTFISMSSYAGSPEPVSSQITDAVTQTNAKAISDVADVPQVTDAVQQCNGQVEGNSSCSSMSSDFKNDAEATDN